MHSEAPLKRFFLAALLWLPLWFVLWYALAALLCQPVILLASWALDALPALNVRALGYGKELHVFVTVSGITPEGTPGRAEVVVPVNVLMYCWNLPVVAALLFAADAQFFAVRKALLAYALLLPVQAWGVAFDVLKSLAVSAGPLVSEWAGLGGVTAEFVALGYQFGYLMLPVIAAITLWVALNRRLINTLLAR